MNAYLFVYGTLLHSIESSMANYLKDVSTFIGTGHLKGRMYDLGRYPGVVVNEKEPKRIFGHIFKLKQAAEALKVLDYYEAIPDGENTTSEYIRCLQEVESEGNIISCWVYVYNLSTDGLTEIKGGNYLEFIKNNPEHRQFIQSV